MNCTAPQYMAEVSQSEFLDTINNRNWLRDGWANGIMYHDAKSYEAFAFLDEVTHKFYKAKPRDKT